MKSLLLAVSCAVWLAGCAIGNGPVFAPVTLNLKGPVAAGSAATGSKVGRSEAWGILVDHETMNILGIYAKYVTIVYGE
jgi:hypothetical protein